MLLLSTAYLPPVEYFAAMADFSSVMIEAHESYLKQSYRSRCMFLGATGPESLQVPILHNARDIKEIEIDYHKPWTAHHRRALMSAYGMSPFYEHYSPDIFDILESHPKYLYELNTRLTKYFIDKLYLNVQLLETPDFFPVWEGHTDLRYEISPKKHSAYQAKPYFQVFTPTLNRFYPNLSIVDLLFNEGPAAESYINKSRPR